MNLLQLCVAMPGQTSFRRILLSRILLLSVPVLLMGEYVTYRKARSSLLETARQNMTESAIRKGTSIRDSVDALKANLITASESAIVASGNASEFPQYVERLAQRLPTKVQCIQITDLASRQIVASTCGDRQLVIPPKTFWSQQQADLAIDRSMVYVTSILPETSPLSNLRASSGDAPPSQAALSLVLSAPVYVRDAANSNRLRYALSVRSTLEQTEESNKPKSLTGQTVVIDQDGTILEHPIPNRVGRNIDRESDARRLESILRNALAGRQDFLHLFSFETHGEELLAGYTAIPSPINTEEKSEKQWIVLAITRLDNALAGLEEIQQVLFTLVLLLFAANLIATLFLARDLARPVEWLGDYAINVQRGSVPARIPQNFKIREFNHLSVALNSMVERLTAWATELESAWQEAKTANQLKNQFLTTISHELRTPLNAILGSLRLVRDDCCDDRQEEKEFLQRADDAAIHLLNIINDILDISKIEAGALSVNLEAVELQPLIEEAIDLQRNAIRTKGLQLNLPQFPEQIWVQADPDKLKQVLLNVLGNAIKFTEEGSITVSLRVESSGTSNGSKTLTSISKVTIAIQDTGIGVAPETQDKLFQPFVMVDGSKTRKFGGTGLGLAISRNLTELMGGSVSLYSEGIDRGTTVEITLPKTHASPSLEPIDVRRTT